MYKVIRNIDNLLRIRKELPRDIQQVLMESSVNALLESVLQTLDTCYGTDRDLEKDLGGYVILFFGEESEISEGYEKLMQYHHLKQNEYEYEDTYRLTGCDALITFRLYQCSSDYAVVTVEIHREGENIQ